MEAGILTLPAQPSSALVSMAYSASYGGRRREVRELSETDRQAVIHLLSEDPLRGMHLLGMIEDHGICHAAHRGRFFGYFDDNNLVNVALLGHHILIYSEIGLRHFAAKAHEIAVRTNLLLGPTLQIEEFWAHFSQYGYQTRLLSPQYWMVCRRARLPLEPLQVENATLEQLDEIVKIQAELVREQSGIDPRDKDEEGFVNRVHERLERERTFVKVQDGKIVFKAELISETDKVVYLESIWTHPDYRGRGITTHSVNELTQQFLNRGKTVTVLVGAEDEAARRIYERVGFVCEEDYQARFLKPLGDCFFSSQQ